MDDQGVYHSCVRKRTDKSTRQSTGLEDTNNTEFPSQHSLNKKSGNEPWLRLLKAFPPFKDLLNL